jgi:RNA polymerase sigma factor (sigma-70 family)
MTGRRVAANLLWEDMTALRSSPLAGERAWTERELVLAAKQDGGAARDALVELFLPAVAGVARRYRGAGLDRAELLQDGVVGLLRALERYDPELGTPFWAYATWWVRQAMQQLVSEVSRPVVLSDRAARQLARVKHVQSDHEQVHGVEPTPSELAAETGLDRAQVGSLMAASRRPRGLDEPTAAEDGSGSSFGDLLADPRAEDAFERVPTRVAAARIAQLLAGLSERERTVLRSHYGLDGPERTLHELGVTLGVTAERVRQIESGALDKLRFGA